MVRYLDFEVVRKLDYFPVKVTLSPHYSPQTIMDQKTLDYKKYRTIPFGVFVQADNAKNLKFPFFADNLRHLPTNVG